MKKLTQEIFKGLPTYIKSAMINGYGILEFTSVPKEQLKTYGRKWHISFYKPHQYPPVHIDWLPNSFDNDCKKYIACDTTNWQQSVIDRGEE